MRHCPICGTDMAGQRPDAAVCSAPCRAELSRVNRLLSGSPVDGHESLAAYFRAQRGAQATAEWAERSAPVTVTPRQVRLRKQRQARLAVARAIEAGELVREPCEVCGDPKTHGHHDDYDKPLEVRWLCPAHHGEHHRYERALQRAAAASA